MSNGLTVDKDTDLDGPDAYSREKENYWNDCPWSNNE